MEPTHFSSFSQNFEFLTSVAIEKAMERDARTVFVTNLPLKVTDRELYRFFEKSGRVNDIRLIHDRNTRRSKGMGYVEYRDAGSIHKAQDKLSGRLLNGQSVVIAPTQAEKNHEALKEEILKQAAQVVQEEGPRTLYVGSLHAHIKERDLKLVFEPFGELDFINLHMDERTGQSKGYAFVQFTKPESAKAAFGRLNGLELAGSKIRVGLVKDMAAIDGGLAALEDEDAMGTIRMNAQSRALLMSKLQRSEADAAAPTTPSQNRRDDGTNSAYVLIQNMFDPLEEEKDFEVSLREDVVAEADNKHGKILHCQVDPNSAGFVYLRYSSGTHAAAALKAFNGRWFGGRQITAQTISESRYLSRWPDARK